MIVPTLCVGMQPGALRVPAEADAERGNDLGQRVSVSLLMSAPGNNAEAVAR